MTSETATVTRFAKKMRSVADLLEKEEFCKGVVTAERTSRVCELRVLSDRLAQIELEEWSNTKALLNHLGKIFVDIEKEALGDNPNMDAIILSCVKTQNKIEKFIESKEETR